MKISKLIKILQECLELHGDAQIIISHNKFDDAIKEDILTVEWMPEIKTFFLKIN